MYRNSIEAVLQPVASSRVRRAAVVAVSASFAAALSLVSCVLTGCGQQYRPVVSAINPVGPAGQPTKYAVAISNPDGQQAFVTGYTLANSILTVTVPTPNPFLSGQLVTLSGFRTSTFLNGQTVTVLSAGLTTTQFQANFTHANAAATENGIASLLGNQLGLVTIVDFSGDTILTTPQIQTNPSYFQLNTSGSEGFTINAQGSFDFFGTTNPTSLITSTIGQTTLPASSQPISISAFTPASSTASVFIPEVATSNIAALNSASAALYDSVAVDPNPIYVVGADNTPRVYAISQGATPGVSIGTIAALETATTSALSVSAKIPVGISPVYGVMTADTRRAFILSEQSATAPTPTAVPPYPSSVSVVNVVNNALDSTTPTIFLPSITYTNSSGNVVTTLANPVWAALSPTTSELIVLNQGDGIGPGTLSIISIPLCNASTPVTNPNCNSANPVDAVGFGTIIATVPVGVNPAMVAVQQDGSTAYVANSGNATTQGSVTAINLVSGTVLATIQGAPETATATLASCLTTAAVCGHPTTISSTTGTPTGKVYVTSPDSKNLTILYTNTNTVQDHIQLQGTGVRVLVTAP